MRLQKAHKWLKGKKVRVLTAFETRGGTRFAVNEIVEVYLPSTRGNLNVERMNTWPREMGRAPASYFELADDPGPPPAKPLPNAPKKSTWVRGKLKILPSGAVSVGGAFLSDVFAEFDGKNVYVALQVKS